MSDIAVVVVIIVIIADMLVHADNEGRRPTRVPLAVLIERSETKMDTRPRNSSEGRFRGCLITYIVASASSESSSAPTTAAAARSSNAYSVHYPLAWVR